ncbi:MAG: hypothetical protein HPY61_09265 [Methanotrichaceae archaeon]|nr:hypothetical protein [Methanotrichaceae archaeon]
MQEPSIIAEAIEIPVSEFQHVLEVAVDLFNYTTEIARDAGILRGRELAKLVTRATEAIKASHSPIEKLHLIIAYIRQILTRICEALKNWPPASPAAEGKIRQAITKIQLRAQALVEHITVIAEGKKEISFNSCQARQFLAGREGRPPSRRDTIRALRRAERLCPALVCNHTPNDGRQTIRLTGRAEDLRDPGINQGAQDRDRRQRLRMEEARIIFFKEGAF